MISCSALQHARKHLDQVRTESCSALRDNEEKMAQTSKEVLMDAEAIKAYISATDALFSYIINEITQYHTQFILDLHDKIREVKQAREQERKERKSQQQQSSLRNSLQYQDLPTINVLQRLERDVRMIEESALRCDLSVVSMLKDTHICNAEVLESRLKTDGILREIPYSCKQLVFSVRQANSARQSSSPTSSGADELPDVPRGWMYVVRVRFVC